MKNNELRLGNLVEKYLEPQISEWVETTVTIQTFIEIETNPNKHGYRPIQLTEEWLFKLGFEKIGSNFVIRNFFIWYSYYSKSYRLRFFLVGSDIEMFVNLDYVHDLQNLYFAITGEELTLKT